MTHDSHVHLLPPMPRIGTRVGDRYLAVTEGCPRGIMRPPETWLFTSQAFWSREPRKFGARNQNASSRRSELDVSHAVARRDTSNLVLF